MNHFDEYESKNTSNSEHKDEFSVSKIQNCKFPFEEGSITGIGNSYRSVQKCMDDAEKETKTYVRKKIKELKRIQELMKLKMENYLKILHHEVKKREEENRTLKTLVQEVESDIVDCKGDVQLLSQLCEDGKKYKINRRFTRQTVLKNGQSNMNSGGKNKEKQKLPSKKKKKSETKVYSTSGKKKKTFSPPSTGKQIKKLII